MKKVIGLLVLSVMVINCAKKGNVLHFYTWADYVDPAMIDRFEEENNCRVIEDTFDSNEAMYAKLKAGAAGYDVIVPSSYMVDIMKEQNMLSPLDPNKLPNLGNIDPAFARIVSDPQMKYSVPWAVTVTGIAYLANQIEKVEPTCSVFEREDLRGRMTLLNDMRETVGAALKYLGYSINSTDEQELQQARDVVIKWKQNIAKFENEQYKIGLASEEFYLVHGYSGDILQVMSENEHITFFMPKEGGSVAMDELVIPANAPHPELAHAFINFMLQADVAAKNTEFTSYLFPNIASYKLLPPELLSSPVLFPPEEAKTHLEVIQDLGEDNQKYTRIWDQIKAAE